MEKQLENNVIIVEALSQKCCAADVPGLLIAPTGCEGRDAKTPTYRLELKHKINTR